MPYFSNIRYFLISAQNFRNLSKKLINNFEIDIATKAYVNDFPIK